jgi:hypothetical protein
LLTGFAEKRSHTFPWLPRTAGESWAISCSRPSSCRIIRIFESWASLQWLSPQRTDTKALERRSSAPVLKAVLESGSVQWLCSDTPITIRALASGQACAMACLANTTYRGRRSWLQNSDRTTSRGSLGQFHTMPHLQTYNPALERNARQRCCRVPSPPRGSAPLNATVRLVRWAWVRPPATNAQTNSTH